ncbi:hypothetical protein CSC62_17085 [Pseudoxanthomonas jiangsuensis]|uniref:hypothetical protein n=1 Tax=Pseudoxanthomonas jiangsuensis TaxID=619688 RepID=UPI00139074CE|nr:hypothetical protein [Pseudoxanthomonas jiangsuensis]KAF1689100.1 hypothetical protein CSC62_17085 [Pseudoxanthomonas jiangsuensis]
MELRWHPITGPAGPGEADALFVAGRAAARMVECLNGTWFALLRYPGRESVMRDCTDYATGRAGIEAWARRHQHALEADAHRRNLEWLAAQTWRGEEAVRARAALAALR